MVGYPPQGLEPAASDDPLQEAVARLGLESRPLGPPDRPSILLTTADEVPWSPRSTMVVLSARLLRTLLLHARFWRPRRRSGRTRRGLDLRV